MLVAQIFYMVFVFLTLIGMAVSAYFGIKRDSEGLACLTGLLFFAFAIELIGVWNLATYNIASLQ